MLLSINTLIVIFLSIFSIIGLSFRRFYFSCIFHPASFPTHTKWHTLLSSACIHANGFHALFNLGLLYIYGNELERLMKVNAFNPGWLLVLFVAAISLANLLNLGIHRHHLAFSSVGVSNGVFAIMAATLLWSPHKIIHFMPFITLPNMWLVPILWFLNIIYAVKSKLEIVYSGHLVGITSGVISTLLII
nr:rhomboid family intramembrane serine protease [Pseudopedobacter sp.]